MIWDFVVGGALVFTIYIISLLNARLVEMETEMKQVRSVVRIYRYTMLKESPRWEDFEQEFREVGLREREEEE